jgi:ring-1,2-phenylacetyl-CoA epoxidase subunit PaaC
MAQSQDKSAGTTALFEYVIRLADNALIISHRLQEWCAHAPELEEDIALANIGLDHLGQARALYAYAGKVEGKGRGEDDLAFLREERDYHNVLLAEQPNGDFGQTMMRQFLFDAFNLCFMEALTASKDEELAAIAAKSVKEVRYHLRHSANWVIRLGDGTEESHKRMVDAIDALWMYTGELFEMDDVDQAMLDAGIGVDKTALKAAWDARVAEVFAEATLEKPEDGWMASGGREGRHTEHMGYILTELQYMQRAYPGMEW